MPICREGVFLRTLAELPLAEDIPIAFNSCRKGMRSLEWRDDKPAELAWIECQVSLRLSESAFIFLNVYSFSVSRNRILHYSESIGKF